MKDKIVKKLIKVKLINGHIPLEYEVFDIKSDSFIGFIEKPLGCSESFFGTERYLGKHYLKEIYEIIEELDKI